MSEPHEPRSPMEQKLQAYYGVHPRPDFLPGLKQVLLQQTGQRSLLNSAGVARPAQRATWSRPALVFLALVVLVGALFLVTPNGRALAQQVIQHFRRASSDRLPVQVKQQGPVTSIPDEVSASDPADITQADDSVAKIEQEAGFDVLEPPALPESLSFVGATYEADKQITRLFYELKEVPTNGIALRQEPHGQSDDCDLCGLVGESAEVEQVQIGSVSGEYVQGVWNLTDSGPVWQPDPYLQTLRWRSGDMAFELLYMGPPEVLTKDDLVAFAASLNNNP